MLLTYRSFQTRLNCLAKRLTLTVSTGQIMFEWTISTLQIFDKPVWKVQLVSKTVFVMKMSNYYLYIMWKMRANISIAITLKVGYLLSNGVTGNVVHCDLDLHFQCHEFWNVCMIYDRISQTAIDSRNIPRVLQSDVGDDTSLSLSPKKFASCSTFSRWSGTHV